VSRPYGAASRDARRTRKAAAAYNKRHAAAGRRGASASSAKVTWTRALALFLGGFTLLNLGAAVLSRHADQNVWWVDLRSLPVLPARIALGVFAVLLVAYGLRPAMGPGRRVLSVAGALLLVCAALDNAVAFYLAWSRGEFSPTVPLPLSLVVAVALVLLAWAMVRPVSGDGSAPRAMALAVVAVVACGALFPLAQMLFFGTSDYRRHADVIVVLGAQVRRDGTPSHSLEYRVKTACALYGEHMAPVVIMSGGPGNGVVSEPQAMRALALSLGVPAAAIVLDSHGVNTAATVTDTSAMFRARRYRRILVVSDFYHLPRVKMAYLRAGFDVSTVPSHQERFIAGTPFFVLREVAAFWDYYLRDLVP
jgi:vancomycin permeability regulator SanA